MTSDFKLTTAYLAAAYRIPAARLDAFCVEHGCSVLALAEALEAWLTAKRNGGSVSSWDVFAADWVHG